MKTFEIGLYVPDKTTMWTLRNVQAETKEDAIRHFKKNLPL